REALSSELQGKVVVADNGRWTVQELTYIDGLAALVESTTTKTDERVREDLLARLGMSELQAHALEMRMDFWKAVFNRSIVYLARGILPAMRSVRRNAQHGDLAAVKFMLELSGYVGAARTVEREQTVDLGNGQKLTTREVRQLTDEQLSGIEAEVARAVAPGPAAPAELSGRGLEEG
ncbi:MAG: hypothetical protein ACREDF_03835, partial [Thermoplasmata archaeon]